MVFGHWQHWQGQVVDGTFPLLRYLGGTERSAAFVTQYGEPESRPATIKLVAAESAGEDDVTGRWQRAAQLSHPHLVRIHRVGSCQANQFGLLYCVMEYAEEDLASVLRERPLTPEETRQMLDSVLQALSYIHGRGLVHGHLKPANILAIEDTLKIASDGIVRAGDSIEGPYLPTPYDPPELEETGFSASGDIWSLGVTLAEALNQRRRDRRSNPSEAGEPAVVPGPLLEVARSCLQRDPVRRASVSQILKRLKQDSAAPRIGTGVRQRRRSVAERFRLPLVAVGMAATLAGVAVIRRGQAPQTPASNPPRSASIPEQPKRQPARTPSKPSPAGGSADRQADPPPVSAAPRPALPTTTAAVTPPPAPAPPKTTPASRPASREVAHQVLPSVPQSARATIHGTVRVSVRANVDASGRVVNASLDSPGPSKYFADLSLRAARNWRFSPAEGQWLLRFEFTNAATRVHPVRVAAR